MYLSLEKRLWWVRFQEDRTRYRPVYIESCEYVIIFNFCVHVGCTRLISKCRKTVYFFFRVSIKPIETVMKTLQLIGYSSF